MQTATKALVIKVMDIRDNDRLITLLTAEFGLIKAFVSGAKKTSNKNHAATSLFCYSDFLLAKSGDTYKVKESTLISSFFKLSSDILDLSLAQYFCELAGVFSPEDNSATEHLRLTLNSLNFLCKKSVQPQLLKAIFEMRLMTVSGYMPDLVACAQCGKFDDDLMCFYYEDGSILCHECRVDEKCAYVDRTLLSALRHIIYSDFEKLFNFSIPEDAAVRLNRITEEYLIFQTDRRYHTLDFYKSLL